MKIRISNLKKKFLSKFKKNAAKNKIKNIIKNENKNIILQKKKLSNQNSLYTIPVLILVIPTIYYLIDIFKSEIKNRNKLTNIKTAFWLGAIPSVFLAIPFFYILTLILNLSKVTVNNQEIILSVIGAPFIEEFTKGIVLLYLKK